MIQKSQRFYVYTVEDPNQRTYHPSAHQDLREITHRALHFSHTHPYTTVRLWSVKPVGPDELAYAQIGQWHGGVPVALDPGATLDSTFTYPTEDLDSSCGSPTELGLDTTVSPDAQHPQ